MFQLRKDTSINKTGSRGPQNCHGPLVLQLLWRFESHISSERVQVVFVRRRHMRSRCSSWALGLPRIDTLQPSGFPKASRILAQPISLHKPTGNKRAGVQRTGARRAGSASRDRAAVPVQRRCLSLHVYHRLGPSGRANPNLIKALPPKPMRQTSKD